MSAVLCRLEQLLEDYVIGHAPVKRALILALLCREHVYLEGPPGTAKTRMAELLAWGSGLRFFRTQLHRDTRLPELLGDVVIERKVLPGDVGEQIRHRIEPGRLLTAEVALLDDVSRAPGEALNVLLQVLNERRFDELELPLQTVIATGNPTEDDYANEALDPAYLDRFALQLRVSSLLTLPCSDAARQLLDRFADAPGGVDLDARPAPVLQPEALRRLQQAVQRVEVPAAVRDALLAVLRRLVVDHECDDANSLLTDRTFLVKVIHLLRGSALMAGRNRVALEDLEVLVWMTTFRLPAEVHARLPEVLRSEGLPVGREPATGT